MSVQFLQLAMPDRNWSPHQYLVCVPPRAAYSHSASLGSRYAFRVAPASQATNCLASLQLTFVMGASSLPVATKAQAFAAAHWFHSRTEAGYWLIANGLIVTWWVGFSVTSSLLPMMKLPPRSTFISGSRTAAVNAVVGVAGDAGCGGNAACFPAGATEGAGWVWGGAGGVTGDAGPMAWVWGAAGGVAGDAGGEG